MHNLIKNIKLIRKAAGLTQKQLGVITHKSTSLISMFESGQQKPDEIWINLFLEHFQISEETICNEELKPFEAMMIAKKVSESIREVRSLKDCQNQTGVTEIEEQYQLAGDKNSRAKRNSHVGRKIDELLTKHRTNRTHYANDRLGISVRTLQRVISGEIAPDFYMVATIAQDHGESLDFFREGQMPKGHLLTEITLLKQRVSDLEKIIGQLEDGYKNVIH